MKRVTFARKQLIIPYGLFMLLFVVLPVILMLYYAFTNNSGQFTFDNFAKFFTDFSAFSAFLLSLATALLTTVVCLVVAYPVAYILTKMKLERANVLIVMFILPMWVNFLFRMLALQGIFKALSIPPGLFPTVVGMVYDFFPFMLLPIYNSLQKMDQSLIEAAQDLGANPVSVFFRTVVPLSMPGVLSGIMMVFMPTISAFAISDILSGKTMDFFGTLINRLFNGAKDWNYGAALSFIMLVMIGVAMLLYNKFDKTDTREGGNLW